MRTARIATVAVGTVVLGGILASCQDASQPLAPVSTSGRAASQAAVAQHPEAQRRYEEQFGRFVRHIAGFGGYGFDRDGNLHVFLTDTGNAGQARAALAQTLAGRQRSAHERGGSAPRLIVHRGAYEIAQLHAWHEALTDPVLALDGLAYTGLDPLHNRIAIGLVAGSTAAVRPAVERQLAELGIPAGAVTYEETTQPMLVPICDPNVDPNCYPQEPPPSGPTTLSGRFWDLEGGVRMRFRRYLLSGGQELPYCSVGFNAYLPDGTRAFVTASHCSSQMGVNDGTGYYQPDFSTSTQDNYVGAEVLDPAFTFTCPDPQGQYGDLECKQSDVSAAALPSTLGWRFGQIARPYGTGTFGVASAGDTRINPDNPHFQITSKFYYPQGNEVLDKVGFNTGWTYGYVSAVCRNVRFITPNPRRYVVLGCQEFVDAFASDGDSGAPVFLYIGNSVAIAGTVVAKRTDVNGNNAGFIYTPLSAIELELGTLSVY